jgi:hypothetical protein
VGVAILCLPFFLIAHLLSYLLGFPVDGYSALYQYAILCAAIFYLWIGLLYLRKLLRLFGFTEVVTCCTVVLVMFGTALLFYTIGSPDYSHVYSFTAITAFVYFAKKLADTFSKNYIIPCFLLLGMIILLRPINGMVVFALPFIAGSWKNLFLIIGKVFSFPIQWISGVLLICLLGFIQLTYYYLETNSWFVWAYMGEGFNFLKPHFFESLFGYRRGLFVYTPLTFLCLFGFIKLYRSSVYKAVSLFIFLVLVIYGISSWHCWIYGMCFQLRPVTEYLSFFAILLASLLSLRLTIVLRMILYATLLFTVVFNSVQYHQYRRYILSWDQMDSKRFWKIFMRTGRDYEGLFWGNAAVIYDPRPLGISDTFFYENFENFKNANTVNCGYKSAHSIVINNPKAFSPTYRVPADEIQDSTIFYVSAMIRPLANVKGNTLNLVFSINDSSATVSYNCLKFSILELKKNEWFQLSKVLTIGPIKQKGCTLSIYFWNPGTQKIQMDNMVVEKIGIMRRK